MKTEKYCLLVDDDWEDQEIFIDALQEVSPTTGCYAVSNGEEALRTLLDEHLNPDYIFTDLRMPVMDGLKFLSVLRSMEGFRNIPVIVFSSDLSETQIDKIKPFGVTAVYSKNGQDVLKQILKKYFPESQRRQTIL